MKSTTKSSIDRAREFVATAQPAISGQRGHDRTFAVACRLVQKFKLPDSTAWQLLNEFNKRCVPPWSERELRHKLDDAGLDSIGRRSPSTRRRYANRLIDPATAVENYLKGFRAEDYQLWEQSPIRLGETPYNDSLLAIEHLYRQGELVNIVTDSKDGKPVGHGLTLERNALIAHITKNGLNTGDAGGWLRMNPVDGSGGCDRNVSALRYVLLECDHVSVDLQLSLFAKLPLPIAALIASGGRSIHAWVQVDLSSAARYVYTAVRLFHLLDRFGVDDANKNPSRMSRLPGVQRVVNGSPSWQRLLYLNPNPIQRPIL